MTHYDLTAASLMLGKLIDPAHQRTVRRERLTRELIAKANAGHVDLLPTDITWHDDNEPEIDGMPADQWVDAMTMD